MEREYLSRLEAKPLLIISNYEEPYLRPVAEVLVLNSPQTKIEKIKEKTIRSLEEGRLVLITSQAITSPYWQYDGHQFHLLSRKKSYPKTQGQQLLEFFDKKLFFKIKDIEIFQLKNKDLYCFGK